MKTTGSRFAATLGLMFILQAAGCTPSGATDEEAATQEAAAKPVLPLELPGDLPVSRWGDSEAIEIDQAYQLPPQHSEAGDHCIRIRYTPSQLHWGAVYWQLSRAPGAATLPDLSQATRLTLRARGETGGEILQFRLAGRPSQTLLLEGQPTVLTDTWKTYDFDVHPESLKMIEGGLFGVQWISTRSVNAQGLTFYLDDIRYE